MPTYIKTGFWEKTKKGYREWLNLDQFIDSRIPAPTYKVYTALLTQSGGDAEANLDGDGGEIEKGFTYTISANPDNYDLTIYGASNNEVGTIFVSNQTIFLSYTSSLELSYNEGAPVVTVLENTIGDIWFTYVGVGVYRINNLEDLFLTNKTFISNKSIVGDNSGSFWSIENDSNSMLIGTLDSSGINIDSLISNHPIEIRVYN